MDYVLEGRHNTYYVQDGNGIISISLTDEAYKSN